MKLPIKSAKKYLKSYNFSGSDDILKAFTDSYKDYINNKISARLFSAISNQLLITLQQTNISITDLKLLNAIESASELAYLNNEYPKLAQAENNLKNFLYSLKTI